MQQFEADEEISYANSLEHVSYTPNLNGRTYGHKRRCHTSTKKLQPRNPKPETPNLKREPSNPQVQQFEADEEISYANNVLLTKKKDARKKYDAGSAPPKFFAN